jgi:hypothetical protein
VASAGLVNGMLRRTIYQAVVTIRFVAVDYFFRTLL